MFIVSITYKTDIAQIEAHMDAHKAYLQEQYEAGHFIASGRKVPRTGGIILWLALKAWRHWNRSWRQTRSIYINWADYEITEFMPTMVEMFPVCWGVNTRTVFLLQKEIQPEFIKGGVNCRCAAGVWYSPDTGSFSR